MQCYFTLIIQFLYLDTYTLEKLVSLFCLFICAIYTISNRAHVYNMLQGLANPSYGPAWLQYWGKLLLKVMHYNIALLPKKVTNYVT